MILKDHLIFCIVFLFCLQFVASVEEEYLDAQKMLDRYILDYMMRHNMHTTAQIFASEASVGDEPVVMDSPEGFLKDWWEIFYAIYMSRQQQGNTTARGESSSQANVEVVGGFSSQRNVEVGEGSSSQANMPYMGMENMNYPMPTPTEMNYPTIMGQLPNVPAFHDPQEIMSFEQFNQMMMMGQLVPSFQGFNMMQQQQQQHHQGQPSSSSSMLPPPPIMQDQGNMNNATPFLDLQQLRHMLPSPSSFSPLQPQHQQHHQPQYMSPRPVARENSRVLNLGGRAIPRIPTAPRPPRFEPSDAGKGNGVALTASTGQALTEGGSVSPAMPFPGFHPFTPTADQVQQFSTFPSGKGTSAAPGSSGNAQEPTWSELAERLLLQQANARANRTAETQADMDQLHKEQSGKDTEG